jgi:multiphosphoryl transfer protein
LSFTCVLVNGVHARPASHIESLCNGFESTFQWYNTRTDRVADGKSVLSLIGADILSGDECHVTVEGVDEVAALAALAHFIEHQFPLCDEALPEHDQTADREPLPESLTHLSPVIYRARFRQ